MKKKSNPWIEVESSNIKGLRYNDELEALDVMFKSGAQYRYTHVEKKELRTEMEAIRTADSPGKKFNEVVKNHPKIKFELLG